MEEANSIPVDAIKAGDREAFARFVDQTSTQVYRVVLRILGNEQDAEDALQETYLKVFRSLKNFEGRSSLTTWLFRIAVNEALMILRRRKSAALSLDEDGNDDLPGAEVLQAVDWCCLPESDLLSAEAQQVMDIAIDNLPPGLKIVFIMRDIEGFSIQQTAEALRLTEGVVKIRLLRARLRLRQDLSVYYGGKMPGEGVKR